MAQNKLPKNFKKLTEIKSTVFTLTDADGNNLLTIEGVDLGIEMNLVDVNTEGELDFYVFRLAQAFKAAAKERIVAALKDKDTKQSGG